YGAPVHSQHITSDINSNVPGELLDSREQMAGGWESGVSLGDGGAIAGGWYPDPADDARLRRWDGEKWTQDVILAPEEAPAAFVPPPAPANAQSAPSPMAGFGTPPGPRPPAPPQYAEPPAQPGPESFGVPFGATAPPTTISAPPPPPPSGPP